MIVWLNSIYSCSNWRFLGHILNWGLMSYWGITVMINILTIIPYVGNSITQFIRRSSYVTINRILIIHYAFGFILGVFIIFHLVLLHNFSSSSPLINSNSSLLIPPIILFFKDCLCYIVVFSIYSMFLSLFLINSFICLM